MISVALIGKKQGLTYQSIQLDMGGMYRSNRGSDMSGTLVYPTVSYVGMLGTTSGKARTARYIPVRYIPVLYADRLLPGGTAKIDRRRNVSRAVREIEVTSPRRRRPFI
ncbi:hypothetical protein B296_00003470 [Ensete ventricosum]|uniref:Uncharacterized protein n=1 Tax=Ensete ventricosum TaxID=4639 RepID=A0A427BBA2_ENSVE|nr:hypothetical protein B296_00003470 [Ensete ventricosum]